MKNKIRFSALVLICSFFMSGCLGHFAAFNGLKDWNAKATDNRWVNEGIFLVLNFVPVYGLATFADAVVLNSIEFWTGENPLTGEKVLNAKAGSQQLIRGEDKSYAMMDYREDGSIHVVTFDGEQRGEFVLGYDGENVTASNMNGEVLATMDKQDALAVQ